MKNTVNYERWRKLISKMQLTMIISVFIVEVINNALLYISRSQGYGPDTIVVKLLRYLVMTSVINFGTFGISQLIVKKNPGRHTLEKYTLVMSTIIIVSDVSYSHYQFADTFCLFVLPVIMTILYEDTKLCRMTFLISLPPLSVACLARGMDIGYNRDIAPEAAIAFAYTILSYIIARLCISNIIETREKLDEALIYETNY